MPAGNRRIGELKRKIAALGTPNLGPLKSTPGSMSGIPTSPPSGTMCSPPNGSWRASFGTSPHGNDLHLRDGVSKIDQYFQQTFTEMFGGGKGALVLEDPDNPLTCGIEIRVQPPASS